MPAPNALRTDTRLTNVAIGYTNEGYIADDVAPILLVDKQAGSILEADLGTFVADPEGADVIAMGELPGLLKADFDKRSYNTRERAKGIPIHDDEVDTDNAENAPYDVLVAKTEVVTERLLLNRELRVSNLFKTASQTDTPTTKWDDVDSDPLGDIIPAMNTVRTAIGRPPNAAIVPWTVLLHLGNNNALKSYFSGGATTSQLGILSVGALAQIFKVQNIYVPSAGLVKEGNMTAGKTTGDVTDVWGDDVYLFYKSPLTRRGFLSSAITYVWRNAFRGAARNEKGLVITRDYDTRKRTLIVDARTYSEEQILIDAAIYRLSDVLTY